MKSFPEHIKYNTAHTEMQWILQQLHFADIYEKSSKWSFYPSRSHHIYLSIIGIPIKASRQLPAKCFIPQAAWHEIQSYRLERYR